MFKGRRILVSTLLPAAVAALAALGGCGQRGPLHLPGTPAASLPETLNPVAPAPATAASAPFPSRTTPRP